MNLTFKGGDKIKLHGRKECIGEVFDKTKKQAEVKK